MGNEPWYGIRLIFRLKIDGCNAYEERILIVHAESEHDAMQQADQLAREYENETIQYTGYAMSFHIFDENGSCLGPGVEVFSLMRCSDLSIDEYIDRFHDSGNERARS